ncbi:SdrD B-like domain-containing protein [Microbacterium excoecariae]|uniref:SdrD B-like domain-containing protein n=1 Tax=Microbacterium excoecariae TaxID=2715210 RepID=UPI00140A89A1|nr:SdrD B-like domain-containing protein [Microbacterium excoecariae]NHI16081.1 hypothetical protein [Microbacterium excoecariae]
MATARLSDDRARAWGAFVALFAIVMALVVVPATSASAAVGQLEIDKRVNGGELAELVPGDEFSYVIEVQCSDADCIGAEVSDTLPSELAGFALIGAYGDLGGSPIQLQQAGCTPVGDGTWEVTESCTLTAVLEQDIDGGVGLASGQSITMVLDVRVPDDLPATWEQNGQDIVNTAVASWDNGLGPGGTEVAATVDDPATVLIQVATSVGVEAEKSWQPAVQQFSPGTLSQITIGATHTSNVPAQQLTIQDPTSAVDGATSLGEDNPFRLVDFDSLGDSAMPAGATGVAVDYYLFDGSVWAWNEGAFADAVVAPSDPSAVGGIRLRYEGAIEPTAEVAQTFEVAQRENDRVSGASLQTGAALTNVIDATVAVGDETATSGAEAPYQVGGLTLEVGADKTISPAELPAGAEATATLTATNSSNGPLSELTIEEAGFFDGDMLFGGFPDGIAWPAGAAGATIAWEMDGALRAPVAFDDGDSPEPATGTVTGFVVAFSGAIEADASAAVDVSVLPQVELLGGGTEPVTRVNTITTSGTNSLGTDSATADDDVTVYFPEIDVALDKTISPGGAVLPGGSVVSSLHATTQTGVAQVQPSEVTVEDAWREDVPNDLWNGFDVVAIAPTQVLAGVELRVSYRDAGGAWNALTTVPASADPQWFTMSRQEFAEALGATAPSDVTGLRFEFVDDAGFAAGSVLEPNIVFEARGGLRDGSGATSVAGDPATVYENVAFTHAHGEVEGIADGVDSEVVTDNATAQIISYDGEDGFGVRTAKAWVDADDRVSDVDALVAQSGDRAVTRNSWLVARPGAEEVRLTDPAAATMPDAPEETVFQAFDLVSIEPITHAVDPLMQWDDVATVELYIDGAWQLIAAPSGGWNSADGFIGYTLTDAERAATTGVRLTVVPDDGARAASTDPTRPDPGTGVASSSVDELRDTFLTWVLRNTVRVPGLEGAVNDPWVTADHGYNDADPATVWNSLRGDTGVGTAGWVSRDSVAIVDTPPGVRVEKTATPATVVIPESADVAPENYPTVTYQVRSENASLARASFLRVTDPIPCAEGESDLCASGPSEEDADPFAGASYDPATNPYERLTITGLSFDIVDAEIDADASIVTLWEREEGGALSTWTASLTAAESLEAGALENVVGVSVLYRGASPEADGGSIANGSPQVMRMATQVRQYERSAADVLVAPTTVANDTIAQSYDPVSAPDDVVFDTADADVTLVGGALDVALAKVIEPASQLEVDLGQPVRVSLTADSADATVATQRVTVTDDDADFWDAVRLADDPAIIATRPQGAEEVRLDALVDGSWATGTWGDEATLPDVDRASIVGLRAVFRDANGEVFSRTSPPEAWEASLAFDVVVLATSRSGLDVEVPSTLENTARVTSERTDGLYASVDGDATDTLDLDTGTFRLDVAKTQPGTTHNVDVGESLPWTLEFTNAGTGLLTLDELVDTLPEYLAWDDVPPTYATTDGGTLSTDVDLSVDDTGRELTFTWPDGGARMQPGESFTITIGLVLQRGLEANTRTTNAFVVDTAEVLDACTNTTNSEGTIDGLADDQCGTTNWAYPPTGGAVASSKFVSGDVTGDLVDGETNTADPEGTCTVDAEGFTRYPCAAYTAVGATDEWKVNALNSGGLGYESLTIVDPLPRAGDRMLGTGVTRESTFQPVLVGGSVAPSAPEGTTSTIEVSTDDAVCVGTGDTSAWADDRACDAWAWTPIADFGGAWADVTALRVTFDFAGTADGLLLSGDEVDVRYRTTNEPASAERPGLAPIAVPTEGGIAWNQIGVTAFLEDGNQRANAPVRAGVTLLSGDLAMEKVVSGHDSFAPDEFAFTARCTVGGAQLALPDDGTNVLNAENGFRAEILGLPLGAECVVSEEGEVGAYGEAERVGDDATVTISEPSASEIPAAQTVVVENVYAAVSVGDYVWIDADGDGMQGEGEAPLGGVAVELRDAEGAPVAATETDENGFYAFTGLPILTDFVIIFPSEVVVDGLALPLTVPAAGDGSRDSNPGADGAYAFTSPATGENRAEPGLADDPTIDAGYLVPDEPVVPPEPEGGADDAAGDGTGELEPTGGSALPLIGGLGIAFLIGAGIVLAVRRRRA